MRPERQILHHDSVLPPRALSSSQSQEPSPHVVRRLDYRPDIDGLRAIAVIAVVTYHAFPGRIPGGYTGVDVFFVISGFLITSIILADHAAGKFTLANFYSRRITRIFPALALVLSTVLVVGWSTLGDEGYAQLGRHALASAAFAANLLSWSETSYFDVGSESKPLLHLWSLGVEEQFYVVWPLAVAAASRNRKRLWLMSAVALISSLFFCVYHTSVDQSAAFYSPITRFWELAAGALLAARHDVRSDGSAWRSFAASTGLNRIHVISVIGIVLVGLPFVLYARNDAFPGWRAGVPVLGTCLLIAAGPSALVNRRVLANRGLVGIGLVSYPLYLWHWPLLAFSRITHVSGPSRWTTAGIIFAALALAIITWFGVERPLRSVSARKRVVGLSCAMGLVACAALAVWNWQGVPGRFSLEANELASYRYDHKPDYREGTCFLREDQDARAFNGCGDDGTAHAKQRVLLWGDSHAAHLYFGLQSRLDTRLQLAQFTAAACPPIVFETNNGYRQQCKLINEAVLAWVRESKPAYVVLAANWKSSDISLAARTVARLQTISPKAAIVLVGPVPHWEGPLPRILLAYSRRTNASVPNRLWPISYDQTAELDRQLELQMTRLGVHYVSALRLMCNEHGCVTKTTDRTQSITAWDSEHVTRTGSELLARGILKALGL